MKTDGTDRQSVVLLVDDAPMNLKVLATMVRKLGREPASVQDGRSALAYVAAHPVGLVLTDLWMLEMDGARLAEAIHGIRPDIPVYAVTADAESTEKPQFRSPHLKRILVKPVRLETLREIFDDAARQESPPR